METVANIEGVDSKKIESIINSLSEQKKISISFIQTYFPFFKPLLDEIYF